MINQIALLLLPRRQYHGDADCQHHDNQDNDHNGPWSIFDQVEHGRVDNSIVPHLAGLCILCELRRHQALVDVLQKEQCAGQCRRMIQVGRILPKFSFRSIQHKELRQLIRRDLKLLQEFVVLAPVDNAKIVDLCWILGHGNLRQELFHFIESRGMGGIWHDSNHDGPTLACNGVKITRSQQGNGGSELFFHVRSQKGGAGEHFVSVADAFRFDVGGFQSTKEGLFLGDQIQYGFCDHFR
mmetsp:Transcript_10422/g.28814  ORF Transcript_10422/g.28814 Transcript_10422/m.28814 type:complete len:240 (+) Transcript_10422:189-908(+)